jgi:hypothetical protein
MAKKCPISNFPIDILTHKQGAAYQVTCPKTGWFTPIMTDLDEAIEFRSSANIAELLASAKVEQRNGRVRLVGAGIMTSFLPQSDLDAILETAKSVAASPKAKAKGNAPAQ